MPTQPTSDVAKRKTRNITIAVVIVALGLVVAVSAVIMGSKAPDKQSAQQPSLPTPVVQAPTQTPTSTTAPATTTKPAITQPTLPKPVAKTAPKPTVFHYIGSELTIYTAKKEADGIHIEWTQRTNPFFQGYRLVRSETNPNLAYPGSASIYSPSQRTSTSFVDKLAKPSKTYYYRACSIESTNEVWCGNIMTVHT